MLFRGRGRAHDHKFSGSFCLKLTYTCYVSSGCLNKFENSPNIAEIHVTIAVPFINMVSHRLTRKSLSGRWLHRHNLQSLFTVELLIIRNLPLAHAPFAASKGCAKDGKITGPRR
jgi:hypothetical protein